MAYSPENNPYIPGDPYSYDLKWLIQVIKKLEAGQLQFTEDLKAAVLGYIAENLATFLLSANYDADTKSIVIEEAE